MRLVRHGAEEPTEVQKKREMWRKGRVSTGLCSKKNPKSLSSYRSDDAARRQAVSAVLDWEISPRSNIKRIQSSLQGTSSSRFTVSA